MRYLRFIFVDGVSSGSRLIFPHVEMELLSPLRGTVAVCVGCASGPSAPSTCLSHQHLTLCYSVGAASDWRCLACVSLSTNHRRGECPDGPSWAPSPLLVRKMGHRDWFPAWVTGSPKKSGAGPSTSFHPFFPESLLGTPRPGDRSVCRTGTRGRVELSQDAVPLIHLPPARALTCLCLSLGHP